MSIASDFKVEPRTSRDTKPLAKRYGTILRRVSRLRFVRWFALGCVVLFWVATQSAINQVEANLGALETSGDRDPFWAVTQLNVDTNRFLNALADYRLGDASQADVLKRLDIIWSRNDVVTKDLLSSAHQELDIDLDARQFLGVLLPLHEQAIMNLGALNDGQIKEIQADFEEARAQLHQLAIELLHAETVVRERRAAELQGFLKDARMMGNMLLVFMLLLVFVFAIDSARLRLLLRGNSDLLTEARSASDAKSQFISVVSHELRTPLTSINGSIKLLLGGGGGTLNDTARNLLTIANRNAVQLARIIDDLLDIEKLEKGGDKLNREDIDLSQIVQHALQTLEAAAKQADIRLTGAVQSDIAYFGDASRLARVFDNLLSNALKFTEAGGTVHFSLRRGPGKILIDVRDTGIGIAPDQLDKIFERFHQVDGSDRRKLGGAGLGLSIAQTIVKMHGGTIEVESVLGKGTVFSIELPDPAI